jgi:16S rRNA processing protein RimM
MNKDACFELGYVEKSHGLKGEVIVVLDVDYPEDYEDMESVFLDIKGKLVPFFVEQIQVRGGKAIIKFEDIDTLPKAQALKGALLYLPLSELDELEEDQFYFHEITGFTIEDDKLGTLGIVTNIYELPMQEVVAMDYKGKEVLFPLNDEVVTKVDRQNQTIYTSLPDGLLDVYLDDTAIPDDQDED